MFCACTYVALFVPRLAYNHYANFVHGYNVADADAQGITWPWAC